MRPKEALKPRWLLRHCVLLTLCILLSSDGSKLLAQCAAIATSPKEASECAARNTPMDMVSTLDTSREYSLAELVDVAEHNNPETRIAWERAKQLAKRLGMAQSGYFPLLVGIAAAQDQRTVSPFPKALLPRGYSMVEIPVVQPEMTLQYLLFDFGKRVGDVGAAKAEALAAGASLIYANQQVALTVSKGYYDLLTAQERVQASEDTLKTAQTTQEAAEARLKNGRATLPDVLNARAESAQAVFDLESSKGQEEIARVSLAESLGVEPSPNINIRADKNAPRPDALVLPIDDLIQRAMADRPDLAARIAEVRAADQQIRAARSAYWPSAGLSADVAQTAIWPKSDNSALGAANETTWSVAVSVQWRLFDGGATRNQVALARSQSRLAKDEARKTHDRIQREVWSSYIAFRTAQRQEDAAVALLASANASYSSSLDAYNNGVKNLVDVVTAEKQLALARLSSVSARSRLFNEAVQLEFTTGNLLRHLPPATLVHTQDGPSQ